MGMGRGTGRCEQPAGVLACAHMQLNLRERHPGHAHAARLAQVQLHMRMHACQPPDYAARLQIGHGPVVACSPGVGNPWYIASTCPIYFSLS